MENIPKINRREFLKKIGKATVGIALGPTIVNALSQDNYKNTEIEKKENIPSNEQIVEELFDENTEIVPNNGERFLASVELWYKRYAGLDPDFDEKERQYKERKGLPLKTIKEEMLEGWQRLVNNDLKTVYEIIKKNNLPIQILFLALTESHWKINAKSRKKAKGPWQFMPATARKFGLKINKKIDERMDVEKSTQAACEYLKELYSYTESYELKESDRWIWAFWAYNRGEGNIFGNDIKEGEFKESLMDPEKYFDIYKNKESINYAPRIFGLMQALKEILEEKRLFKDTEETKTDSVK